MRDRGAACAVIEFPDFGLAEGGHKFIDLGVAVHTGFIPSASREASGGEDGEGEGEGEEEVEEDEEDEEGEGEDDDEDEMSDIDKERFEAQMELFDTLLDPSAQAAVLNLDDPMTEAIKERVGPNIPFVTYGIENIEVRLRDEICGIRFYRVSLIC